MSFNPMTKGEIVIEDSQASPEFMTLEKLQNLGRLSGHEKPGVQRMKPRSVISHKPS